MKRYNISNYDLLHSYCYQSYKYNINKLCQPILDDYPDVIVAKIYNMHARNPFSFKISNTYIDSNGLICPYIGGDENDYSILIRNDIYSADDPTVKFININDKVTTPIKSILDLLDKSKIVINNIYNAIIHKIILKLFDTEARKKITSAEIGKIYSNTNNIAYIEEPFVAIRYNIKMDTIDKETLLKKIANNEFNDVPILINETMVNNRVNTGLRNCFINKILNYKDINIPLIFFPFSSIVAAIGNDNTFVYNSYKGCNNDDIISICNDLLLKSFNEVSEKYNIIKRMLITPNSIHVDSNSTIENVSINNIVSNRIIKIKLNDNTSKTVYSASKYFNEVNHVGDFNGKLISTVNSNYNKDIAFLNFNSGNNSNGIDHSDTMHKIAILSRNIIFNEHKHEYDMFSNMLIDISKEFVTDMLNNFYCTNNTIEKFMIRLILDDIQVFCNTCNSKTYGFIIQARFRVKDSQYKKDIISVPIVSLKVDRTIDYDRKCNVFVSVSNLVSWYAFMIKLFKSYINEEINDKINNMCTSYMRGQISKLVDIIKNSNIPNIMIKNQKKFKKLCRANKELMKLEKAMEKSKKIGSYRSYVLSDESRDYINIVTNNININDMSCEEFMIRSNYYFESRLAYIMFKTYKINERMEII